MKSKLFRTFCASVSVAALYSLSPATAQEADAADSESVQDTVVVQGFRQSLNESIAIKRNEKGFVDAITAEDIASFPDLNLAESLQRIPGVQIDRDGGEGRSINVRGLSSDFVRVQVNGMEALATTGGRDGRANRNRQFDFNVFAADLFSGVRVLKSQDAAVEEGSLGATVQLRSAKPFDYDGFEFATGVQASYNDLSQKTDPRFTMLVSNRFMDDRLGALLSVAYSKRNTFEEGSSSGRFRVPADDGCVPTSSGGVITRYVGNTRCYQTVGTVTNASGQVLTGLAAQEAAWNGAHPRIPRYGRIGYDRERVGVTGTLQFQPWDGTEITFDTLYGKLDQTRSEEFLEAISFARETGVQGFRATDLVSGVVNGNRTLVAGTFNDVDIRTEQRIDILSTEFIQNTLSFEHDFSETLRLSGLIGASTADGKNPQQTTVSLERYDVDGYSYDYTDPNLPRFDYGFDVTNPANYVFSSSTALGDASIIRQRPNETENTYETARIDLAWDLSDVFTVTTGASFKEFGFDVEEFRTSEAVTAATIAELERRGIPLSAYTSVFSGFGRGLDLPAGTPTSWIIPDLYKLRALTQFDCNCVNEFGDFRLSPFNGEIRSAQEASTGAYLQVDWDTALFSMPFRGNVGVRYVETELTSTGILSGNTTTVTNTYDDTLPALNMVLEPVENVLVRFAAAKTIARPSLNALTPGGSVDASPPGLSLNTGNPFLDPIRSDNLDFSIEWYPYKEALFSVAFFQKKIDTFVQRLTRTVPYSETGFPLSLLPAGVTGADIFTVQSFLNTPGGDLTGYEITLQTPFTFLDGTIAEGFGGLVNYTSIESEFQYITNATTGATVTQPLVGQSPTSWGATLYYERGKFEGRVSATARDEYLTLVPAANGNDVEGKAEQLNVDFKLRYSLTDQIDISFDGVNLTDEFDERWINSVRQNSNNYEHTGREFVLGIRYRY
jgi:TonB-dependent receptor